MDNSYREGIQEKEIRSIAKRAASTYKSASSTSASIYLPPQRRTTSSLKDVCYLCKRIDYWAKDCPKKDSKKEKYINRRQELNIKVFHEKSSSDSVSSSSSEKEQSGN